MSQIEGHQQNQAPFSLINYEAEIQITENIEQYKKAKHAAKKLDLNPSPQDVLNNMIMPRDWKTSDQKYFMQYVSHSKASRDDVFTLKEALEKALQYRQARTEGICPIREELFSQAFDEIIRQVTINCPQRGLLLMRVRDQHKMSLAAYQTLYQSSIEYGMRKQVQSQQGMDQLENQLKMAEKQYEKQKNKKIELQCKKQFLQKKIMQRKQIESMENQIEIQTIEVQAQNLQVFLQAIRQQKSKQVSLSSTQNLKQNDRKDN